MQWNKDTVRTLAFANYEALESSIKDAFEDQIHACLLLIIKLLKSWPKLQAQRLDGLEEDLLLPLRRPLQPSAIRARILVFKYKTWNFHRFLLFLLVLLYPKNFLIGILSNNLVVRLFQDGTRYSFNWCLTNKAFKPINQTEIQWSDRYSIGPWKSSRRRFLSGWKKAGNLLALFKKKIQVERLIKHGKKL